MKLIETIEKCEFIVLEKYMKSEGNKTREFYEKYKGVPLND